MDYKKITCKNGILSPESPVQVGDIVAVCVNGDLQNGVVEKFEQANYLPRFYVCGKWRGKTKLRDRIDDPDTGQAIKLSTKYLKRLLSETENTSRRGLIVRQIQRQA